MIAAGTSPLTPGGEGLYYNRNRHYAPVLDRFLQRDPNESAQETLSQTYQGQAFFVASDGFHLNGDGRYVAGRDRQVGGALQVGVA